MRVNLFYSLSLIVIINIANYLSSEIVDIVGIYYAVDNNAREATRQYELNDSDRRHTNHKVILRLIVRTRTGQMKRKRSKKLLNNDDSIIETVKNGNNNSAH